MIALCVSRPNTEEGDYFEGYERVTDVSKEGRASA
jgi:hypothetical protein